MKIDAESEIDEHRLASKSITDRNANEAQYLMIKRVGDTEFRPIGELAAEDQELAEAMKNSPESVG